MIQLFFQAFYLMIPSFMANMSPIFFRRLLPLFDKPVDMGIKFNGKPLLGEKKTWGGVIYGTLMAILFAYLQYLLQKSGHFQQVALLDYSNWILIGFLLGFGALAGDILESFVKRRLGLRPSVPFVPFDQLDFAIGSLLLLSIFYPYPLPIFIMALLLSFILHILTNHMSCACGFRKERW